MNAKDLMEYYANLARKCNDHAQAARTTNSPAYILYEQAEEYCLNRLDEALSQRMREVSE